MIHVGKSFLLKEYPIQPEEFIATGLILLEFISEYNKMNFHLEDVLLHGLAHHHQTLPYYRPLFDH